MKRKQRFVITSENNKQKKVLKQDRFQELAEIQKMENKQSSQNQLIMNIVNGCTKELITSKGNNKNE